MTSLAQEVKATTEEPANEQGHSEQSELRMLREELASLRESVKQLQTDNKKVMENGDCNQVISQ